MAIEFVFYQDSEFDDPYYDVLTPGGVKHGIIQFAYGNWYFLSSGNYYISQEGMIDIIHKLDEVDESLKQQRILGVF